MIEPGVLIRVTDGGTLAIGDRTVIGANTLITVMSGRMRVGADSFIGSRSVLACETQLIIGRNARRRHRPPHWS